MISVIYRWQLKATPHTRGSTLGDGYMRIETIGYPAYAGIDR